jgi:translation initiation factor IF-3
MAEERGMDLVEVAPSARPPVCRIMDFGKYQYQMSKRAHEARKHQKQVITKEVKLRPKTDEHDYQFKKNHVIRFLSEGNKAKVSVIFKGREVTHTEIGRQLINRMLGELSDLAEVEKSPKMEGFSLVMILAPKKQGKPGGGEHKASSKEPKPQSPPKPPPPKPAAEEPKPPEPLSPGNETV